MIPIFTSNYSIGEPKAGSSILTLEPAEEEIDESSPVSIFSIAKKHGLDKIFLLEKRFSGFHQALKNSEALNAQLVYGIKFYVCDKIEEKTEESWKRTSKINLFAKNKDGVKELIKIYSLAFTEGFYESCGRIDWNILNSISDNIQVCVPFYDSFIFENMLNSGNCIPILDGVKPIFFIENNGLPFDGIMADAARGFAKEYNHETQSIKSIFYYKKQDFVAYQTFRCFDRRSNLEEPRLEHFSSDEFSFESWLERKQK